VVPWKDLFPLLSAGLLVFPFNNLCVILQNVGQPLRCEYPLPEIIRFEPCWIGRIARAVIPALIEGQEPRALALQLGAEAHLVLVDGEVNDAAAEQGEQLVIRAPIRVEADGSFRMNAPVRDGADAYLLVGSRVSCEKAAHQAAQQALQQLEGAKPVFALLLVDIAWEMLLKSHPGSEVSAVQDILAGMPW